MINFVIDYFKTYNVNIVEDDILYIKNIKIPNFYKICNDNYDIQWEFCHLLYKLYANYYKNNTIFYENNLYKITNKDIVFDCGANMGLFSIYAASCGAEVYSFEPMSFTRELLVLSQELYPNIHILPYALKEKNKKQIFVQTNNPGASHDINLLINKENTLIYQENITCISLDNFCKENNIYPTFIKIDVEGSEKELLNGAKNILKEKKPILSLGLYHYEDDIITIPKLISNINFLYDFYFYTEEERANSSLYLFAK